MFFQKHWRLPVTAGVLALAAGIAATGAHCEEAPAAVPVISLSEAIHRAEQNEPVFVSAVADSKSADVDRSIARTSLLPSAVYHNQVLYTQPNGQRNQAGQVGSQEAPVFIANNAVREYASQVSINETIGLKQLADAQAVSANAAKAAAEAEIARRGLVATVVGLYYSVAAAQATQQILTTALDEARNFSILTQKREEAREVAHADVIKAQLQQQERQRALGDARLEAEKSRLELAVLLFPDPRTPYETEGASSETSLPSRTEANQLAAANNPEIRSALASLKAANAGVSSAKAAYLPDLSMNFSYGIDAPQFATHGPDGVQNLGYSISGTLDIPVWDWFSRQKRVKQSEIRRDAANVTLNAAQRRAIASLDETYDSASTARDQLDLLDESVRTAAENLRLTKLRYSAGESSALEVVDAQNEYIAAETAQSDGVLRYQSTLAALQLLIGNL